MPQCIGFVAHDACKDDLLAWVAAHRERFLGQEIVATGTTGGLLAESFPDLNVRRLMSGPLGGDAQLATMIAEERIALLVFLIDPMSPQPHDVDVRTLLRMAVLHNVPAAFNLATADYLVESRHFGSGYKPGRRDFSAHLGRLKT